MEHYHLLFFYFVSTLCSYIIVDVSLYSHWVASGLLDLTMCILVMQTSASEGSRCVQSTSPHSFPHFFFLHTNSFFPLPRRTSLFFQSWRRSQTSVAGGSAASRRTPAVLTSFPVSDRSNLRLECRALVESGGFVPQGSCAGISA